MTVHTFDKNAKTFIKGTKPPAKEKFVLAKTKVEDEMDLFKKDVHAQSIKNLVEAFFNEKNRTVNLTAYNIIVSPDLLDSVLSITDPKLKQTLNALKLRVDRFRLKYYLCYKICGAGSPSAMMEMEELLEALKSKVIRTDYKDSSKDSTYITQKTTLALVVGQIRDVEIRLRRMVPYIHKIHGVDKPECFPENYLFNFGSFINGLSCSILEVPPDWVYILSFLAYKPITQLKPEQLKQ